MTPEQKARFFGELDSLLEANGLSIISFLELLALEWSDDAKKPGTDPLVRQLLEAASECLEHAAFHYEVTFK